MRLLEFMPQSLEEVAPVWRWVGAGALAMTGYVIVSQVHYGIRKARSRRQRAAFRQENIKHKQKFAERIRQIQPGRSHEAICALSVTELQEALQKGSLKPSQVLRAYQRKVVEENEKTNCVADYILEAEELAAKLDNATEKGPLYGIPISVKEILPLKGHVSTWGNWTFHDHLAEATFIPVETLIRQGAIPFVRSNIPYMALSYTGWNPLYGDCVNPHDPTRHPGSSSGGEAAMVATGATPFGLGSDMGGSIRNPSAWCGIVGLKCGCTRLSSKNMLELDGLKSIVESAYGPMARDVDSAVFVMRHLLVDQMFQADRTVPPLGWRQQIYEDRIPLRIGYYINNGVVRAVPAVERAVRIAKKKLEAAGHTLVPFEIPENDGSPGWGWPSGSFRLFMGDGGSHLTLIIGDDVYGKELIIPTMPFPKLPMWFNYYFAQLVKIFNKEKGKQIESICESSSVSRWWSLLTKFHGWRRRCLDKLETQQIDAILSPAMAAPALPHKLSPQYEIGSYLTVYNLLDWPAGVVPVTKVTVNDVADMRDYPTNGPIYSVIQQGMHGASGLPVNVQIAGPPYSEELILRLLKQIEEST